VLLCISGLLLFLVYNYTFHSERIRLSSLACFESDNDMFIWWKCVCNMFKSIQLCFIFIFIFNVDDFIHGKLRLLVAEFYTGKSSRNVACIRRFI